MSATDPVAVVAEAIHWYGRNPIADVSVAEVIVAALRTAGLLSDPSQTSVSVDALPHPPLSAPTAQQGTDTGGPQ